jgi:hypothetical protein
MNLGGSTSRGSNVPNNQTTSFDQLSEFNKRLRQLDKNLCCKLDEIANNTAGTGSITGTVTIDSSCAQPVYVEVCNQTPGIDKELVFTTAVPICVDNGDNTKSTWYTRESIVWDSVTFSIVSRTTEYSSDGVTWGTTAPSSFVLGTCADNQISSCNISEAFGNDLSTLLPGNNFSITKPSCCKVKVTTSVGSFHVIAGIQSYNTSDFNCPISVNSVEVVSGTCSLDQIHIISNKIS